MGFIYRIVVAGEIYIGSTKQKYLSNRQSNHNYNLRNPNSIGYNTPLYIFCREHNVEKIICELIEKVDNDNITIKEQTYMDLLNPTINTIRAFITEEQKIEQQKEYDKKRIEYKKEQNKIKANCPICNKEMIKNNIKQHIRNIH